MIVSNLQKQSKSNKVEASHTSPANAASVPNACSVHIQIRERAFQLFQSRGGGHGHDMQDWLHAERQVMTS
jgi:hypothetical protein